MLTKPRLLTPGPTPMPERVRLAMAQEMIHHRKPVFKSVMAEVSAGLAELFGTSQPVIPLTCSGTGAMVAAVSNLFAPGEKVLVVRAGRFGQRWLEIADAYGLTPVTLEVPWGEAVNPAAVREALKKDEAIAGVLVQHSETTTGVQHPIRELAEITRDSPALMVVDGVSAVSIAPCPMDAWGIDCLLTGSQKGLMIPPGLGLVAFSERAWKKTEQLKPKDFYFNLLKERDNHFKNQTAFTSPVTLFFGLRESLRMFREIGLNNIYRKQWALTMMARKGVEEIGLELYAKKNFTWGVTSLLLPEGMEAGKLLAHAADKYGVTMSGTIGNASMVRIGHMGWIDYIDLLAGLHALAASFRDLGGDLRNRNYMEQAMAAYWSALEQGHPQ